MDMVKNDGLHVMAQRFDVPENEVAVQRLFRYGEPRGYVDD